ncbi:Dam family site-specific DNA-(adenine-N6)-methyltransferase [Heliorestis acidaminivorans]|uniref:Site-specific DNA-methyltransferase (adenine-specific) n=1 Tax=Heliorestis acidaminivorans TaxID=553427 RepID=A0A6I0F3M5_9FIRM|nr:Dam family site-specific DNA-(adenine-N6)-methyltransferase [Heliorestis acidaminivorans]KAB2951771.1 Dam family site-specific DNA-(adenine-N6)-methyltransferase [Heliorestis acidaminivorans]
MRPFLKWPGGKHKLVQRIEKIVPPGSRLVEPFVGSGAFFLATEKFNQFLLADTNADLIHLYQCLQQERTFIEACRALFTPENNSAERYYALRDQFNQSQDLWERSTLFLYLNRHGYNGLCRYNKKRAYNVPFGSYKAPYFPEKEMINFHEKAQRATFLIADFRATMAMTVPGDVVYCDPPYTPLSATSDFTAYDGQAFRSADQKDLANEAEERSKQGIDVLISNHATAETIDLYSESKLEIFDVRRTISCQGDQRKTVKELLAYYPACSAI